MGTIAPYRKMLCSILVCLFIINGLNAKEQCKKGCPSSDSGKLKYQPGHVYEYNFDSVITISVSGTDADETSLKVLGHANIYSNGNCEYILQLEKVILTSTKDNLRKQLTQDIKKPLQFTMSSDIIDPQICVDENDSDYSINIKRGIISMFQSSEKDYETDVFGVCPTSTKISNIGGINVITKVRNLNSCGYRESYSNGIISGIVNENAGIKSSSLLTGEYTKEQKINNGIIETIELYEDYLFIPSSVGQSGAKAKVKTNLKLINQQAGSSPALNGIPKSIIFKHPKPVPVKNIEILKKVFETTVNQLDGYAKSDAAQYFTELIRLMRTADVDTLTELSGVPHHNKNLAKKVYFDALFRTGTSDSVKSIVRQISKMSEIEKKYAFLSFNLVEDINRDALIKSANLLNAGVIKEAYLSIGNLIGKYCRQHSCDDTEINGITKKFTDNLKQCKAGTRAEEDRIVYALKGIRNTHKIANAALEPLTQCILKDRSARLRIAGLQALSADSCNQIVQQKLLDILRDRNEDSEIRIEAYLSAVSCPNAELGNHIAEIINSETVNQVGGFITSHLRSIRDSTEPSRESARYYLGNIRVTKKFPIDPRRYSFNNEISYSFDTFGVGASADYNLIYSQNGFLPRSGRLNLTSEIFGRHFNLIEFNARQENLESIMEYYFGPKGVVNQHPQQLYDHIKNELSRSKRSISDDAGKFSNKYKTYGGKYNNDINFDLSLKMFGSEFFFLSLGDNIPTNADEIHHEIQKGLEKIKEQAKSFQYNCQYHSLFLDTEIIYPSGIGLPIELVAQGTAAGNMKIATELNIDDITKNLQNSKGRIKIIPSIDLQITGQLRVVGSLITTGVKVSTNLHSASGSDVNLQLENNGNKFNLDIELPRRNIDLIELKHDIEFFVSDREKQTKSYPIKHKKKPSEYQGTFDQLQMFGITVDYTAKIPEVNGGNSPILLTGPIHVALKLESETKIQLSGIHEKTDIKESYELYYDTPGSKISHKSAFKIILSATQKGDPNGHIYGRAEFHNPQKQLALEAGGVDNNNEFALYGKYEHDSETMTAKIGFTKHGQEYHPLIQTVSSRDNQPKNEIAGYKADGKVIVEEGGDLKKYKFENFRVIQPKGDSLVINGYAAIGPHSAEGDLDINAGGQRYQIKGLGSIGSGDYKFNGYFTEPSSGNIYGGEIALKHGKTNAEGKINIKIGENSFDLHNNWEWNDEKDIQNNHIKYQNEIILKKQNNIVGSLKCNGDIKNDHIKIDLAATQKDKKLAIYIDLEGDDKNPDYKLDFNAKLNKHFIDIKSKSETKSGKAHVDNTVTTSWGTQLTAKGEIGPNFSAQDIDIDLQGTAILSSKDKPTSWVLKANGSPEKTTGELKINRDNADVVTFSIELNRPGDKPLNGKINFATKDTLVAKGDFKMAKNGRGDLSMTINLKKLGKKLKAESKFLLHAPKYDIETTIFFDPDKDKSKKIYYKTENIVDKQKFSTKNILELGNEKYGLDVSGINKGELYDGEIDYKFIFILPSGRQLDGSLHRKLNTKSGVTNGVAQLNINDKLSSNQKRSINIDAKMDNYRSEENTFNVQHHIVLINFDGKTAEINTQFKHLPKDHFKMFEAKLNAKGDMLEEQINFDLNIDEYCEEHAIYHITYKYGDKFHGTSNGNYYIGSDNKPFSYETQININAPTTEFKKYIMKSNGKLLIHDNQNELDEGEIHIFEQIGNNEPLKLNINGKCNLERGTYHIETHIPKYAPVKIDATYLEEEHGNSGKYQYTISVDYENGKIIKTTANLNVPNDDTIDFHYTLQTPYDTAKNIDLIFKGKKSNDDTYATTSQLNYNGNNYGLNTVITINDRKSAIDIIANCPDRKSKFSTNIERFGDRKGQAQLLIENIGDLNLNAAAEGGFQDYENFYIKIDIDSVKLKLNKLHIEAHPQHGTSGKGVEFLVKDEQQQILSGSATYNVKHEKGKAIVEGQGTIQYYQKTTNANFKLVRQNYEQSTDKEIGFSYTFNGTFGPKNIVSAIKVTNKNFHVKLASCEEKKQCTNFEIQSVITISDPKRPDHIQHEAMVLIDLRELGYPHEFELQSKTIRYGFKVEHEIEANIISSNNYKYQLLVNMKPSKNIIQIKLPKRDIVFETTHISPANGIFGHYEESITFYFDKKNNPNEKTHLSFNGDVGGVEGVAVNVKGSAKLEHPAIRPLQISGQFDINRETSIINSMATFDIFKTQNQKIIALAKYQGITLNGQGFNVTYESSVKSSGLNFEYNLNGHSALSIDKHEISGGATFISSSADCKAGTYFYASKDRLEFLVNALNNEIISINGNIQKNKAKIESKITFLGSKPLIITGEAQPSHASFNIKHDTLFDVHGEAKLSKEIKFIFNGDGKTLYKGAIALDPAHFLSTQYEINKDDLKSFLKTVEDHMQKDTELARAQVEKQFKKAKHTIEEQIEALKQSTPNIGKLQSSYEKHMMELLKELEEDPVLQNIVSTYRRTYESFMKALQEFVKTLSEFFKKTQESASELYGKLSTAFKDQVIPELEAYAKRVTTEIGEFYAEAIKILGSSLEGVLKSLKSVESELNKLGKPLIEILSPFAEIINELSKTFIKEIEDFIKEAENYFNTLPSAKELYGQLKEKIGEFTLFNELLPFLNEFIIQLQDYIATEEGKEFINKLHDYINAKLTNTEIDDVQKLEELYTAFINAIRSLIASLQGDGFQSNFISPLPYSLDTITQVPSWIGFKLSTLNFIRNEDPIDYLLQYQRPLFDIFPPYDMRGTISDGEHIFTFDGRHIAFPGNCKYIIAQDYINNNFSVIGNLKDGKLKSITLVDKTGFIEINDQSVIKLNGQLTEYPIHHNDLHAWRRYYTVNILTEYGANIKCTTDLRICHITVNGFYTAKTRGLMGNGNSEPYDDFTQPNGVITDKYSNFGNSYGIGNCQPVQQESHDHEKSTICKDIFDVDSTLVLGYLFINPTIYREACDHAVEKSTNKNDAACNIATAYASAGRLEYLPITVPKQCLKCNQNSQEQKLIGQTFQTKVPSNKADFIFVVDTSIGKGKLGELINPIIIELRNQLKSRGINDVHIGVIGYDHAQKYPTFFTTHGKLNFQGDLQNAHIDGPVHEEIEDLAHEKLNEILAKLREERSKSLISSDAQAFNLALDYPFRAGASKAIVAVRSDQLEFGNPIKFFGATLSNEIAKSHGIALHLIGPVRDLSVEGLPSEKIVGFNSRVVATPEGRDAKKRSKLHYTGDMGIDIVHADGGWIFALQNFDKQSSPEQKHSFANAISTNLAEYTSKLEVISDCKCELAYSLHAEETCEMKSTQFVTGKKSTARG